MFIDINIADKLVRRKFISNIDQLLENVNNSLTTRECLSADSETDLIVVHIFWFSRQSSSQDRF